MAGTSRYIPIYGSNLAPPGTTPQVSMDGATLWIVYRSDNQINMYYSYVTLGTHWIVDSSHSEAVGYADNVVSRMYEH